MQLQGAATYAAKLRQADREARATVVALAITVAVWVAAGFGLSGLDVRIAHTPLWVIGGTVGTWLCAIACAVYLANRVFVDVDLDHHADAPEPAAQASQAAPTIPAAEASRVSLSEGGRDE
ncbi:YhdT family protein [Eggerthellaceae bacterium zg-997]|nr:YhdT family protein [Eggerthellaceae bacterium zg-997]